MEDKRITKTKRALKSALLELLTTQAFDVISITELCKIANVSRITFYTHYKDKFALLDDIFNDMLIIGKKDTIADRRKTILKTISRRDI